MYVDLRSGKSHGGQDLVELLVVEARRPPGSRPMTSSQTDSCSKAGRNDRAAQNALQDVYLSSSNDGGETWSPNLRVSDRSIARRLSDVWTTGVHAPAGLHALDTGAYVAWDDTRNAIADSKAQDVYFTRVRLGAVPPLDSVSSSTGTGTKVAWGLGGAALALAFAGLALFVSRSRVSGASERRPATS